MFKPQRKPASRANTRRMMYLVHTAHRGFNNGNLWDLQGYYYTLIQKSQEITICLVRAKGMYNPTNDVRGHLSRRKARTALRLFLPTTRSEPSLSGSLPRPQGKN